MFRKGQISVSTAIPIIIGIMAVAILIIFAINQFGRYAPNLMG